MALEPDDEELLDELRLPLELLLAEDLGIDRDAESLAKLL